MATPKKMNSGDNALEAPTDSRSNIFMAVGMIAILATLLVKMPTPILDMMLAGSISLAICVLIITIFSKEALELSTFPSMLLFVTLFRLSLNVASTRLILLQGDAGKIIQTFGDFVAGGSFVVGMVIKADPFCRRDLPAPQNHRPYILTSSHRCASLENE